MELPPWVSTLRPQQLSTIQEILERFNNGTELVILDAPTGSGKTLIGELVRRSLQVRGLYLCSSIALQSQFARDFPTAAILKGRGNYPTKDKSSQFPEITSADCNKLRTTLPACSDCETDDVEVDEMHCRWCHPVILCPYEIAKANAMRNQLVCTNSYYFLYEANYIGNLPLGRGLIVIDESDTIEDVLLSFVSVQISGRTANEYNIKSPEKKTVESSWVEWAKAAEDSINHYRKNAHFGRGSIDDIRRDLRSKRLLEDVKRLNNPTTGLSSGGWIYTGYDKGDISFKPIEINHLAGEFLWRHSKKWLLMSATTISFQAMVESLGIQNYEVVK